MKRLSDVNVLVALVSERCAQHATVRRWVEALPVAETVYISRSVQMGLLRLLCTEAVMGEDTLLLPQAWSVYARLLASSRFALALEPLGLDPAWARFCLPFGRSPKVVADAYLAAFAVAGGYRLVTLDRAFGQFKELDWEML
jgi:toxin-antitoxin system PIN domain toxin